MSLWIDIINPSHALFFSSILKELPDEEVQITLRERAETVELSRMLGIEGKVVGADHSFRVWKSLAMVGRTLSLMSTLDDFDQSLSFENGMSVTVSKVRGKRSILLCDNDLKFYQKRSYMQDLETMIKDRADRIIIPQACLDAFSQHVDQNIIYTYDGFKEDVYIADYSPDPHFKDSIQFDNYVVLRPEALSSFYVKELHTLVPEIIKLFAAEDIKVIYLPRDKGDADFAKGLDVYIPDKAVNGLDLCYHSMAVLTGSGTMAREAACMGKTSVSFFPSNELLSVDQRLIDEGKMIHSRDPKAIVEYVMSRPRPHDRPDLSRSKKVKADVIDLIQKSRYN
jgi:predicted glycosyltransferase